MTHYYLHIRNEIGFVPDEEGVELEDANSARKIAIDGIRSILSEEVTAGRLDLRGQIEIMAEGGQPVAIVAFQEAVEIFVDAQ